MKPTPDKYIKRLELLRTERASYIAHYRELSDNILGHRGRFLVTDRNKGHKRNTKQVNPTARLASRSQASGFMAGMTSPARPWFRLRTSNLDIRENDAVKVWLKRAQDLMYEVFAQSNIYNSLHQIYSELGVFGTACMALYEDYDNIIRSRVYTVGSYFLAMNGRGEVDTFYTEYEETVGELVKQFGYDNCSENVRNMWDAGNTEAWVEIIHVVEPNDDRDMMSPLASEMPYRSCHFEKGACKGGGYNSFLSESGFRTFAILAPRWDVAGADIYGSDCPGMIALGDIKSLYLAERKAFIALGKLSDPPMQAPTSMKNKVGKSLRDGELIYLDNPNQEVKSIYGNWRPDLAAIEAKISKIENRISRIFYEDLFLMLANDDRRQITAREVAEKHEEKLLMLGPVLERLHTELLDPLIDRTFSIIMDAGILPEPPEELSDTELKVEYVSVLAQAQRMVATGAIERSAQFVGGLAGIWPEARHKFDPMDAIDRYNDALGVDPSITVSDDVVQQRMQAEQQQTQQQMMMEQVKPMAEAVKTASEAKTNDDGEAEGVAAMMRQAGLM